MLADPNTRARYDKHGASSLDVNFMDAGVFFTMLFGSERFEPYIGTLALASAASMEGQLSIGLQPTLVRWACQWRSQCPQHQDARREP